MIITPLSVGAFQTNCYIVQDDNSTFIIDAPAPGEVIINKLKQNKLIPDLLILTHGHFDHVLGIKELKKEFPNIKIAISAHDSKYLLDGGDRITRDIAFFNEDLFYNKMVSYLPVCKADIILKEGDVIKGLTVIETPGHTPGSICLLSDSERVLFSGDTLFQNSIGRTDFYNSNYSDMVKSLEKLKSLDDDIIVLPGHGPSTKIGFEKKNNPYL